jgi:hypothetical protein
MLDRVRDVDSLSLNSGQPERSIKDSPGRSDKRLSGDVFFVTRLFSDEQILFRLFSACEHRLRRISPWRQPLQLEAADRSSARVFFGGRKAVALQSVRIL